MLTIVRSSLCLDLFQRELAQPAFYYNQTGFDYDVLDMPVDVDRLYSPRPGLVLYTNIWPVSNDVGVIGLIERQAEFNSSCTAVTAGLNKEMTTVVYPRKSDIRYPAQMVGYVTLLPALLWSAAMKRCFLDSVSSTMFAELAWDITFPNVICAEHVGSPTILSSLREEYNNAFGAMHDLGLEIHGYRKPHAVPYAMRRSAVDPV